jgi:hypothetical protein
MQERLQYSITAAGNCAPDSREVLAQVTAGAAGCVVDIDGVEMETELPDTAVAGNFVKALCQRLDEHRSLYAAEQDAVLARLETVEQFLQHTAPALQGVLDRFEGEQAARVQERAIVNDMIATLQAEFSTGIALTQAKDANRDKSMARLEAEISRLQGNTAATSKQLITAENNKGIEEFYQLFQNDRDQNTGKYVALEARVEALSKSSFEKLSAFESRVELMNASVDQRAENFTKDLQVIDATVRDQWRVFFAEACRSKDGDGPATGYEIQWRKLRRYGLSYEAFQGGADAKLGILEAARAFNNQ